MARKGDLRPIIKLNVALDGPLALKVQEGANRHERRWSEEVRFALKSYYGIDQLPAEAEAGVSI